MLDLFGFFKLTIFDELVFELVEEGYLGVNELYAVEDGGAIEGVARGYHIVDMLSLEGKRE